MRKALWFLFPLCAVAIGVVMPVQSDAKPFAECRDGVCTISEADWKRYQEFHRQTLIVMEKIDANTLDMEATIQGLSGEVNRCHSQLEKRAS